MAVSDTARLMASLELEDKFSQTAKAAESSLGGLERASGLVKQGFGLLGQAGGAVGGAFDNLKGRIGSLLSGPLGMLGLSASIGGVVALIKGGIDEATDFGRAVGGLARVTGLSTQETSRLAGAFHFFGIESEAAIAIAARAEKNLFNLTATGASAEEQTEDLAKANRDLELSLVKLDEARLKYAADSSNVLAAENRVADAQQHLNELMEESGQFTGGAAAFFDRYGLALTDAGGQLKDFNTLLLDSSDFFLNEQIPAAQKAAALAAIYGRNWQDLIPILAAGREAISDAEQQAEELGLTLTDDNLVALKQLKQATRTWGVALGGLKLQLGLAVIPLLTDLTKGATEFLTTTDKFGRSGMQRIVRFFEDLIDFGKRAFGVIQDEILPVVRKVIEGWNNLPEPLKNILVKGAAGDFAIKFLLGFSPTDVAVSVAGAISAKLAGAAAGAVTGAFGTFIADFFGRTATQKLIPQVIAAVNPIPVFVVNGGVPGSPINQPPLTPVPGKPGAPGGILGFLGVAGIALLVAETVRGALKPIISDPVIDPARAFEESQFERIRRSRESTVLRRGLGAIDSGIIDLEKQIIGSVGNPLTMFMIPTLVDQLEVLKGQRLELASLVALVDSGKQSGILGGKPLTKGEKGGVPVVLTDTAMLPLGDTATATAKLPPILTRQEHATQRLVMLLADARNAMNAINSKTSGLLAKPTSFTSNNNVTVNIDGRKVAGVVTKSQFFSGTVPK